MINVGIVGFGYWGPNVARNFHTTPGARVVAVSDADDRSLARAAQSYPGVRMVKDFRELLTAPDVDVVAIVTPVSSHFEIAHMALSNGKHIFIEKPFTASTSQAEQLIELADRKKLKIMVDHTFLFTGAVKKIKELIDDGTLGDLYYFDSIRVNLGLFQKDVNVVWDLAPHDLSIMDHLLRLEPSAVMATGVAHFQNQLEDVAYITIYFPGNVIAHLNVNWLSPVKIRTTLIGGQKKMLVWNDLVSDEKIRVYDKGVEGLDCLGTDSKEKAYGLRLSYRSGDMWAPRVNQVEALQGETAYFIDCINNNITPKNDGSAGLRVVRILEAIKKSLAKGGALVRLN
ncbi:NAD(P)-dependent oxidoreductase [Citrifermentans bemidjiense Bem]|uniref:NAD(P)-dependent oxidoreductase n=1 Tax=Citrifermentans bemidjiense (strain ATCC BAA-1014 / DSM 16622 / JCM 12645 / Bem) TaxID=404380 RepID=B5EGY3_CITBB|nr:Gfo/Idh/MocA family oxidoreductase [Citrifermentans bemidjiense]ACH38085.1 NAD(P)-dependent oxidoreductase [Citrifermentans bemidjiense Bem]